MIENISDCAEGWLTYKMRYRQTVTTVIEKTFSRTARLDFKVHSRSHPRIRNDIADNVIAIGTDWGTLVSRKK